MLKMYLISDNIDTQTGMRLAGVEGVVVHTPEDGKAAMEKVLADKQIGILIVTEKVAGMLREYVDELKPVSYTHLDVYKRQYGGCPA